MKGKLRIAQLAPLAEAVPPPGYGGSELVVSLLTEELVRRGHDVTLFASQESVSGARLVACAPQALRRGGVLPTRWPAYELAAVLQAEAMQDRFDIVHNHMGYLALPLLRHFRTAVVSTNHNLVSDYAAPVYMACKDLPYVSISEAYRQGNYGQHLNYIATIHNGIDVDSYRCDRDSERPYILFLGRLCPEKGAVEAIQIAQAVAMPIKLAGKVDERDAGYYAAQIEPLVNRRDVEYLGEVSLAEKADLYRHAHCVVMPIAFDEPFGLVMAGNYGLEVSFPDGRRIVNDSAGEARAALAEALSALKSRLPRAASAIIEDHGYSLCIHYHLTPAGLKQMLMDRVCDVARRACSLRLRSLPTSFEFLPDTDFSKADGLDVIVSHLCDDWSADAFFLYIGDSDQDEPAFHWVNCRGGLSIRVGGDPTAALSVLACAHSVADFIARLGRLRQTQMSPPDKGPC